MLRGRIARHATSIWLPTGHHPAIARLGCGGMASSACKAMPHAVSATPRNPARNAIAPCSRFPTITCGGSIRMVPWLDGIEAAAWSATRRIPASRATKTTNRLRIRLDGPHQGLDRPIALVATIPRRLAMVARPAMRGATILCCTKPTGGMPATTTTRFLQGQAATCATGRRPRSDPRSSHSAVEVATTCGRCSRTGRCRVQRP